MIWYSSETYLSLNASLYRFHRIDVAFFVRTLRQIIRRDKVLAKRPISMHIAPFPKKDLPNLPARLKVITLSRSTKRHLEFVISWYLLANPYFATVAVYKLQWFSTRTFFYTVIVVAVSVHKKATPYLALNGCPLGTRVDVGLGLLFVADTWNYFGEDFTAERKNLFHVCSACW